MSCKANILNDTNLVSVIHLMFIREWIRSVSGNEAVSVVDKKVKSGEGVVVPQEIDDKILDCIIAMDEGNTLPGTWIDNDGSCYQDWSKTACFARMYMGLNEEDRVDILHELKRGNPQSWSILSKGEQMMYQCVDDGDCCPSSTWADPAYFELSKPPSKPFWSWWSMSLAAIGVGVAVAFIRKN